MTDVLPELSEADAPPAIRAIYREIRDLSGIPLPALIWRHLATMPDVLPHVWDVLGPHYRNGSIQDTAWKTVDVVLAGKAAGPGRKRLAAAGLDGPAIVSYGLVLDSYNRTNPVNFVGVRVLLATLRRGGEPRPMAASTPLAASAQGGETKTGWRPPPAITGLPPMTPLAGIAPSTRAIIDNIAVDPLIDRSRIVPSLYRHLTIWPGLLSAMHDDLAPRIQSGELAGLVQATSAALERASNSIAAVAVANPELDGIPGLVALLDRFSGLIPEMIVIGRLLRQGLDFPD